MKSSRIRADYHTHTTYSDGNNSMEENVLSAIEKGLEEIGISEHGFGHMFYGVRRKQRPEIKKELERLRAKYPQIKILDNIEANILGPSGKVDLRPEEFSQFDMVLCGYHFGSRPCSIKSALMHLVNWIHKFTGMFHKLAVKWNTQALVNAVLKNPMDVLVHPGDKGPVDILKVAKACEEKGVLMEINQRHTYLTLEQLNEIKHLNIRFLMSSDAHHARHVGEVEGAYKRFVQSGISEDRVVNLRRK